MKSRMLQKLVLVLFLSSGVVGAVLAHEEEPEGKWSGVDETVVEKFASDAGRPARDPYINVGEGDMLLFCFLLAGSVGGFVLGYYFRVLFKETGGSGK